MYNGCISDVNTMREKYMPFSARLKPHQIKFLRERSARTGNQDMSDFVRDAIDEKMERDSPKNKRPKNPNLYYT